VGTNHIFGTAEAQYIFLIGEAMPFKFRVLFDTEE